MSELKLLVSELDKIIDEVSHLNLEEGQLFLAAFQKRLEYLQILIQAKRTKASFQDPLVETDSNRFEAFHSEPVNDKKNAVYGTTSITDNDHRFGILRFSKISEVSKSLDPNSKILIRYKGDSYQGSVPKSVPGRVNGLTGLYDEHPEIVENRKITVQYDITNKILTIE
ncbi:hypothetical protein [Paenibacillus tengchongensis]|uniref:hypothetical protein n=1 Tax=Paenibacillus tengchongensis TaxID=2608684 RepID=UPI00124DC503|nr:hypothetical protein [Paenibacillus tengchongensis]